MGLSVSQQQLSVSGQSGVKGFGIGRTGDADHTAMDELTVATLSLDYDQLNVLPEIEIPLASMVLAPSCTVSPIVTKVVAVGVATTEATVGAGGGE